MDFENLSPELCEKARACKTVDEFFKLAEEEGIALTDEQMQSLSGGSDWAKCPEEGCGREVIW